MSHRSPSNTIIGTNQTKATVESKMPKALSIALPSASTKPINTFGYFYVPSDSDQFISGTGEQTTSSTIDSMGSANDRPLTPPSEAASKCKGDQGSPQSVAISSDNCMTSKINAVSKESKDSLAKQRGRRVNTGKKILYRKERQSYDINQVPKVRGNKAFLKAWRDLFVGETDNSDYAVNSSLVSLPSLVPCDGSLPDTSSDCKSSYPSPLLSDNDKDTEATARWPKLSAEDKFKIDNRQSASKNVDAFPSFASEFESVIWEPQERNHWVDSIDEMTAVCTAASRHRHSAMKKPMKEFSPPISRDYVKERVDIDDPLRGYQIRHRSGGWLQGFIMTTTFTSWTYYFKWDSFNKDKNGFNSNEDKKGLEDDGSLAAKLDLQPRSGDPKDKGVVWPTVAEIVLVGALGCGEFLVEMALDRMAEQNYEYVVLEATDSSRPFYEKLGFVRVGAVAKYCTQQAFESGDDSVNVLGYSHWAPADLPTEQVKARGPPSCMMGRQLKKIDKQNHFHSDKSSIQHKRTIENLSLLRQLSDFFVDTKPAIKPLGNSGRKRSLSSVITPTSEKLNTSTETSSSQKVRRIGSVSGRVRNFHASPFNISSSGALRSSRKTSTSNSATLTTPSQIYTPPRPRPTITNSLLKQDIANMYRHPKTIYYYNKVVTPKIQTDGHKSKYYFVLNYNESSKIIRLIPLYKAGVFTKGVRMGKQKWKCNVLVRDPKINESVYLQSMDVINESCDHWEIVQSCMVTKCKSVSSESWHIL